MKPLVCVFVALSLSGLSLPSLAQVTQTYQYDASGRLTEVTTTGSAGTNTAAYAYDDADNRISRSQTGTTAYATLAPRDGYDGLQRFPSPGQRQALNLGTVALALEGAGDVAASSLVSLRQDNCVDIDLSLSRWLSANSYLIALDLADASAWLSPFRVAVNGDAPVGGDGEPTIESSNFLQRPEMANSERCS